MKKFLSMAALFAAAVSSAMLSMPAQAAGNQSCHGPAEYCETFAVYCFEHNGQLVNRRSPASRWVRYNCEMPQAGERISARVSSRFDESNSIGGATVPGNENPGTVGPIN